MFTDEQITQFNPRCQMRSSSGILLALCALTFVTLTSFAIPLQAQEACLNPPSDLTHWWPADGDAKDIIGGDAYTGATVGGTTFGLGKAGQAFNFNGSNAYVTIPDQSDLNFGTSDFTISFWVNAHSWVGPGWWNEAALIEKWYQPSGGSNVAWGWSLSSRGDGLILSYGDGRTDNHPTSCADTCLISYYQGVFPPTETWYHMAIKRSGSSLQIYRDGANVATQTYPFIYNLDTAPSGTASLLKFGARGNGQNASQLFFNGMIDEVQIYNRALSDNEIANIASVSGNGYCKGDEITVDAGQNVPIKSYQQCDTIVYGMATDSNNNNNDLEYQWVEGANVLLEWSPVGTNGEATLPLCPISLTRGSHTLTLQVREIGNSTSTVSDDMTLTIDNSAPTVAPTGQGTYQLGDHVILGGQVTDYDGDLLSYTWTEGDTICSGDIQTQPLNVLANLTPCELSNLGLGTHTLTIAVNDSHSPSVTSSVVATVQDTSAPTLAPVPSQSILWPPNHKLENITIDSNANDNSGIMPTLTVAVTSNEPQNGLGDGDTAPDWTAPVINQQSGIINLQLRAERGGSGNGRQYTITITATDVSGNTSSASIPIVVPKDSATK